MNAHICVCVLAKPGTSGARVKGCGCLVFENGGRRGALGLRHAGGYIGGAQDGVKETGTHAGYIGGGREGAQSEASSACGKRHKAMKTAEGRQEGSSACRAGAGRKIEKLVSARLTLENVAGQSSEGRETWGQARKAGGAAGRSVKVLGCARPAKGGDGRGKRGGAGAEGRLPRLKTGSGRCCTHARSDHTGGKLRVRKAKSGGMGKKKQRGGYKRNLGSNSAGGENRPRITPIGLCTQADMLSVASESWSAWAGPGQAGLQRPGSTGPTEPCRWPLCMRIQRRSRPR